MANREESLHQSFFRDTTAYLFYILFIVALGPFQFGYHLVS